MQTVSQAWKNNQEQTLLNESFVEVSLDITDPDIIGDVSSQDNGASYFSDTAQVVSEVDRNIAPHTTLEQNLWVLDGSRKVLSTTDYGDNGFVGDVLSNESGAFGDKIPMITLNFTQVHSNPIPAITITWSKTYSEFARSFIVTVYNDDTVVATKRVDSNKLVTSVVSMEIVNFNRITISILRWCLPNHRARIEEIFVGLRKVFRKDNMFSFSHSQVVDPISSTLPKTEVSLSVDNTDNLYNPYNTEGLSKYLMERQEIQTRYGYKLDNNVEWIKGGTFYLSSWNAKQNGISAEFTARDLLEFLFTDYEESPDALSIVIYSALAQRIFESANLPLTKDGRKRWYIPDSMMAYSGVINVPKDTRANYLLMIANATNHVLYQDRDGILRFEKITTATDPEYAINSFNCYSKPEITLSKSIKDIDVKVYTYKQGDNGIEKSSVSEIISVNPSGEQMTIDNPLITTAAQARMVGNWIRDIVKQRMTLDLTWRPDVRLDALDVATVADNYGESKVLITDVNFTYNGAFRGSGKGKVI